MRPIVHALILALALVSALAAPVRSDGPPTFEDRPGVGRPLRFTDAAENVFRPRQLVVVTPSGTYAARLPSTAPDARSEERLDFSGTPLIGHLFRRRLAPHDAAREGMPVGPVSRFGDTLVVNAGQTSISPGSLRIVLTANFPRDGAVSFRLGQLRFNPAEAPSGAGHDAGAAYLLDGTMVLAGPGFGPRITDWNIF